MLISLFLNDKIVNFQLPNIVSGSFCFDFEDNESKLINIEAKNNKWVLYRTSEVSIINNNVIVDEIEVVPNNFYFLKRDNKNYLIFITDMNFFKTETYSYNENVNLLIGDIETSNFRYVCDFLKNWQIKISYQSNNLVLEKNSDFNIYINKVSVNQKKVIVKFGDEIEIYGLRILLLKGLMIVINSKVLSYINITNSNINRFYYETEEKSIDYDLKYQDLYKEEDYYSKSPRIRRLIETKEIKLTGPPKEEDKEDLPLILTIGPMLTMGVMGISNFLRVVIRLAEGEATIKNSWPQLITSVAMIISMIVWPTLTKRYNKKLKKKKKKLIEEKYTNYLNRKRNDLETESKEQRIILNENLVSVNDCLNFLKHKNIGFWDKRIDQSDFLVARIGVGDEKLDVKISYSEEDFSIDENELREKADQLSNEYKYIKGVPIGYSFYDNKTTAIMGSPEKRKAFIDNILIQLITFYSYDDLKIVVFTDDKNKKEWDYVKYLNHTFSNDRTFRFFSSDKENSKIVIDYLNAELMKRATEENSQNQKINKPHYFIIVDNYDNVKKHNLINLLTEIDINLGFSIVILESKMSKLPSKCNNFILLGNQTSELLKNSYEQQEKIVFNDEIRTDIDMMSVAKELANIPLEFAEGMKQLPNSITFLEMEKVGKVEQLNILKRWNTNDPTTSLKAEVGVDEQGDLMYLDLHEKFHGPHGLIAGMTGSGKSEFIITYILSMAINYSPEYVSFILIDYKGGGLAFAFENKTNNIVLPHLAGTITNLDKAEMDRTLVSIDSEIKRRQQKFNEVRDQLGESTIDIYKYQRFYKEGKVKEAIPHLFIICDEFAELKSQQPEFMDNLISVARIGRSLGVHLILATQKPSGVVNDQIWSNTKFRVCLKVQSASDSNEMLKKPDAANIKQTGRFYLQVGYDEYYALGQSGWCGAKYKPSEKVEKQMDNSINFIDDCGRIIKSIQASKNNNVKVNYPQVEQISVIMKNIISVANMVNKKANRLWLDNVPDIVTVDNLQNKYNIIPQKYDVEAIVGEYDAPEMQQQGIVKYNILEDGNTLIYGNDGIEREMVLDSIIYSTAKNYSSEEINYYIIDYGSEALRKYSKLPHIGGIVFESETEKYNNLVKLLKEQMSIRKNLFADYGANYENYIKNSGNKLPLITVIINNYPTFIENNASAYDEIPLLVRDSERYGIVYIITANTITSVGSKVSSNFKNCYALKLKDKADYSYVLGAKSKLVPRDILGRGLFKKESVHEFQTASIVEDNELMNSFVSNFVKQSQNQKKAKKIPSLPNIVRYEDVRQDKLTINNVPIGIVKENLDVYTIDCLATPGFIISSNKIENTEKFTKSFISLLLSIKDIKLHILDPINTLKELKNYPYYYNDNFEDVIDKLIENINEYKEKNIEEKGIIFVNGIGSLTKKIEDTKKLQELSKLLKDYELMPMFILDGIQKIKTISREIWYTSLFTGSEGIWIGRGMAEQNIIRLSTIMREASKDYKNDMGFAVNESVGTLCKYIDFITLDEGENNEK